MRVHFMAIHCSVSGTNSFQISISIKHIICKWAILVGHFDESICRMEIISQLAEIKNLKETSISVSIKTRATCFKATKTTHFNQFEFYGDLFRSDRLFDPDPMSVYIGSKSFKRP